MVPLFSSVLTQYAQIELLIYFSHIASIFHLKIWSFSLILKVQILFSNTQKFLKQVTILAIISKLFGAKYVAYKTSKLLES